eukprot:9478776-Pyramimonas_sp.AAC.2
MYIYIQINDYQSVGRNSLDERSLDERYLATDSPRSGAEGSVIQWDCYAPVPDPIPEECIMRPVYRKGKEIMVYRDCDHLHSAPDMANRKAVWRFM